MALRTNIHIDPIKLERAKKITGLRTAKAVVDFALARLESTAKALDSIFKLSGKIRFHSGYSYKKARG